MADLMLKGLEEIDWKSLRASDVPHWLRDLASQDQSTRIRAYNRLETRLVDGTGSGLDFGPLDELLENDLPLYVVPFLIELLQYKDVEGKLYILRLLNHLATYVRLDDAKGLYKIGAEKVHNAVHQGVDTYKSLLSHKSPAVKMVAAELLEELGEL